MEEKKVILNKLRCCTIVLFAIIIIVATTGCGGTVQQPNTMKESVNQMQEKIIKINIDQFIKDYRENSLAADEKYKYKILEITGSVKEIGKLEGYIGPYVILEHENTIGGVWLVFSTDYINELIKLKKGDIITVQGRCTNEVIANRSLENCKIISSSNVLK